MDDLGKPVAGARIRPVARGRRHDAFTTQETRTDKEGRFLLDGLAAGLHRLEISAPRHAVSEVGRVRAPGRSVEVVLTRLYRLTGRVSPMPPGGGEVKVRLAGSGVWPERVARPGADGSFTFDGVPAGIYDLLAGTGQQPWMASAAARGILVGPTTPPPVKLELKPAQQITGRVRHDESPVEGAVVVLGQDTLSVLRARVTTDKEGFFALGPVPLGRYSLGVWASGYLPIPQRPLELPFNRPLELELSRGAEVSGLVQDDANLPLEGAVIWVIYGGEIPLAASAAASAKPLEQGGQLGIMQGPVPPIPPTGAWSSGGAGGRTGGGPGRSSAITGADGRFSVAGLWPGRMRIITDLKGYVQARGPWLELEHDTTVTLDKPLVLRPAATVAGRVLDGLGVPLTGARVEASKDGGNRRVTFSDEQGAFRLEGLLGKVELSVALDGYLPLARSLDLSPGEGWPMVELDLLLTRATGQITGVVLDARRLPLAGVTVNAREGKHRVKGKTGRSGRFVLEGVGKRKLELSVDHPGYIPLRRKGVKAGERVELRLSHAAAVEGEVRDGRTGGPIKGYSVTLAGADKARAPTLKRKKRGRFRLEGVIPGEHTLQARAPGHAMGRRKIKVRVPRRPGGVGLDGLVLELKRAGSLRGQVLNARRRGVSGARVSAGGVSSKTSRRGNFKLEGVPEGSHVVKVVYGKKVKKTDPVVVRAGETIRGIRVEM